MARKEVKDVWQNQQPRRLSTEERVAHIEEKVTKLAQTLYQKTRPPKSEARLSGVFVYATNKVPGKRRSVTLKVSILGFSQSILYEFGYTNIKLLPEEIDSPKKAYLTTPPSKLTPDWFEQAISDVGTKAAALIDQENLESYSR